MGDIARLIALIHNVKIILFLCHHIIPFIAKSCNFFHLLPNFISLLCVIKPPFQFRSHPQLFLLNVNLRTEVFINYLPKFSLFAEVQPCDYSKQQNQNKGMDSVPLKDPVFTFGANNPTSCVALKDPNQRYIYFCYDHQNSYFFGNSIPYITSSIYLPF